MITDNTITTETAAETTAAAALPTPPPSLSDSQSVSAFLKGLRHLAGKSESLWSRTDWMRKVEQRAMRAHHEDRAAIHNEYFRIQSLETDLRTQMDREDVSCIDSDEMLESYESAVNLCRDFFVSNAQPFPRTLEGQYWESMRDSMSALLHAAARINTLAGMIQDERDARECILSQCSEII